MTTPRRHTTVFVLTAVVLLGALAATAYSVRGRLAETPLVADLMGRLGWRVAADPPEVTATSAPDRTTLGSGAEMLPAMSDVPTPGYRRAEVRIDPRRQQLIGVRMTSVERRALTKSIRTVGTVRYDETRLTDINLKLSGWIEELSVDYTGKFIEQGQPLFTLYSPDLLTTQHEYLLALQTRDQLRESPIADAREYADRLVEAARQRLVLWDLPPDQIQALDEQREAQRTMVFRSPVTGFVIEKHVLRGQHVPAGMSLYTIADLSVVWVEADIYESEFPLIRDGIGAAVTVDAYPGDLYRGRVIYVYPYVEERTRTVRVRFEFRNPRGRLKPGMYANVVLEAPMGTGLVVPANALLDSGTERHVFVSTGDGYFDPRPVIVGQRLGENVQILEGLEEGERVATAATFFIDSESQLRAALQGFEPLPAGEAAPNGARPRLDITFRSQPDPPRSGDNRFEVVVADPQGQPVTDAEVSVVFYMAPMPTMNMPAMQTDATLLHEGNGVYRGTGEVMMAGRWDVTVMVSRDGQRIGSRSVTVLSR